MDIGLDGGMQDGGLRLSLQSTITGSSILTDPPDLQSYSNSSSSQPNRQSNGENDHRGSSCSDPLDQESQGYGAAAERCGDITQDSGMAELDLILQGCLKQGLEKCPSPTGQQGVMELEQILQRCLEYGFASTTSPARHQAHVSPPSTFPPATTEKRTPPSSML